MVEVDGLLKQFMIMENRPNLHNYVMDLNQSKSFQLKLQDFSQH